jgi:hypothetical protein
VKRRVRRRLGAVCAVAALGLTGLGRCAADDVIAAPRPEPSTLGRVRQALAERWEKVRRVPESFRRDGVERASYSAPKGATGRLIQAKAPAAAETGPTTRSIFWWSVPRKARTAARQYAAAQHKTVTRVLRVEEADGTAHFEVYAAGRAGLERLPETVLLSVEDSKKTGRISDGTPPPAGKR